NISYAANISRHIVEHTVQRKQNRHLNDQLNTASHRRYAVLVVDSLGLLVHGHLSSLICLSLILVSHGIQFRLHFSLQHGKLLLLVGQREKTRVNQNGKDDDGKTDILNVADIRQKQIDLVHEPSQQ